MAGETTYDFGQCTWYCAHTLDWVQGGWGNATDWPPNAARQGFGLTGTPTVGSVVAYAAGDGYSEFGHVAVVMQVFGDGQFLVSEMNFVAWDQVDTRVSNLHDVEAFILPPGVAAGFVGPPGPGAGAGSPDDVRFAWLGLQDWLNSGAGDHISRLQRVRAGFDLI